MKKVCIIFLMSCIISVTAIGLWNGAKTQNGHTMYEVNAVCDDFLRMHIRADSNEKEAQAVKYAVRDEVVAYLTPLVARYTDKDAAMRGVSAHLSDIASVATEVLRRNGFGYGAKAELRTEYFPTRVYDGCTLPSGEYSALIVTLGSGSGDNWWCVVYPPLCFTSLKGENVVYKSKILEIIERFRHRK